MDEVEDRIAHAKSYPFSIPGHSFIYDRGAVTHAGADPVDTSGRTPVLAAGSNQSPDQLHRKFGHLPETGTIPAQRGRLRDFDVVYAAHLSSYGSVPATFQSSPGTAVTVFVLWLDDRQLARMHETEGNYTYDRLTGIAVETDDGAVLDDVFAYSSKVGCLNVGNACISLAEIPAEGRRYDALSQTEIQAHVRDRLHAGVALDIFIRAHLEDDALRRQRSAALGGDALPLAFRRSTISVL